jgi:hypothetical protein
MTALMAAEMAEPVLWSLREAGAQHIILTTVSSYAIDRREIVKRRLYDTAGVFFSSKA